MTPADYREALYSTWRTDKPWGMKLIDYDSDNAVPYSSADEVHCTRLLVCVCCLGSVSKWQLLLNWSGLALGILI